jgi:hemerythrin-like domain-containing protein
MDKALKLLVDEHDVIESAGKTVGSLNKMWEANSLLYTTKVYELIEFFRKYSDGFHHFKEEDILFPAMIQHPEFTQIELIRELEEHHEMFRENTRLIELALENENYPQAQKILVQYMNDLKDHIAAENEELFPMAESLFRGSELESLYFRFLDCDRELGEAEKVRLGGVVNML